MSPDVIVAWLTLAGAVAGIGRAVYRRCKRGLALVRTAMGQVDTMRGQVDTMHEALGKNGGSTLADMIRATNARSQITDARIDLVIDLIDRPLFECVPVGDNVRINDGFTRAFGYSASDMQGRRWVQILHPDDREQYLDEWAEAVRDKRAFKTRTRYLTRAGVAMTVEVAVEPHFNILTGDVLRWLGRVERIAVDPPTAEKGTPA